MFGKILTFALIVAGVLYVTVKFKDVVMPVAETGTAVVDVLVDKATNSVDTLVKEAEKKKRSKE